MTALTHLLTHFKTPLPQSSFHPRLAEANKLNRWGPWAGYMAALCLGDMDMEYTAIRNGASVYDLCPMIKYRITGAESADYLTRLMIRNATKLAVGSVHYTAWYDDQGKVLDDGTLFRHGPEDYLLCCQERHLPWLTASAQGFDVQVVEVTQRLPRVLAGALCGLGTDCRGLGCFRPKTVSHNETAVLGGSDHPVPHRVCRRSGL